MYNDVIRTLTKIHFNDRHLSFVFDTYTIILRILSDRRSSRYSERRYYITITKHNAISFY